MPVCEGTSPEVGVSTPCPDNRNDDTVRLRNGDLMLCDACTKVRFPPDVKSEVLYFIQNKCHALTVDNIVHIAADFFTYAEVETARLILTSLSGRRLTKHKGGSDKEKCERTITDIVKTCVDPAVRLPVFYSTDMARIPPVGVEHIDVSALVQEVAALRAEVRAMAALRQEITELQSTVNSVNLSMKNVTAATNPPAIMPPQPAIPFTLPSRDQSSFAAKAAALQHSDFAEKSKGNPQSVKNMKPKPKPVIGRSTNTTNVKSVKTKRQVDVFVSRLSPDTHEADVAACVQNILPSQLSCKVSCLKLTSKHEDLYASYHVAVEVESADMKLVIEQVNNPDLWPAGLIIRRYFKPKSIQP